MIRWLGRALLFRVLPRRLVPALAAAELAALVLRARHHRRARAKRVLQSGDDRRRRPSRPS